MWLFRNPTQPPKKLQKLFPLPLWKYCIKRYGLKTISKFWIVWVSLYAYINNTVVSSGSLGRENYFQKLFWNTAKAMISLHLQCTVYLTQVLDAAGTLWVALDAVTAWQMRSWFALKPANQRALFSAPGTDCPLLPGPGVQRWAPQRVRNRTSGICHLSRQKVSCFVVASAAGKRVLTCAVSRKWRVQVWFRTKPISEYPRTAGNKDR